MYEFKYQRADNLADAKSKLTSAEDGKYLAGGQTMIPTLKQRLAMPSDLIDIGRLDEIKGISVAGDTVTIGAGTTHAEVADSADIQKAIPALAALAGDIGDPHVRHAGTLGGSIANNDPAADYPAACIALSATIVTDEREIAAEDFFTGMFETALGENELIKEVRFPVVEKSAYAKFPNPASRYAVAGVFVAKSSAGVRVGVTGAGASVFRWSDAETALSGSFAESAVEGLSCPAGDLNSDLHASADYRAHLVGVMTRRAVAACS